VVRLYLHKKVSLIHDTVRSGWSFNARDGTDY
jgi:hypothetical protein